MTLQVELVLLEPAYVELLARGAALELAGYVLFVVANDPVRLVSCWNRKVRKGLGCALTL